MGMAESDLGSIQNPQIAPYKIQQPFSFIKSLIIVTLKVIESSSYYICIVLFEKLWFLWRFRRIEKSFTPDLQVSENISLREEHFLPSLSSSTSKSNLISSQNVVGQKKTSPWWLGWWHPMPTLWNEYFSMEWIEPLAGIYSMFGNSIM